MKPVLTGLRGLMLDLDGTVYQDNRLIAGAAETIAALRERGYRLRFVTNTTNKRRENIRDRLDTLGIEAKSSEIFTAPVAASLMLRRHPEARCWVVTRGDAIQEFQGLKLDQDRPDFVVLGDLMEGFTFELLNRIFRKLNAGAELIALQKNRYWLTGGKLTLDMGPFVAALEFATGRSARVVGQALGGIFPPGALPPGLGSSPSGHGWGRLGIRHCRRPASGPANHPGPDRQVSSRGLRETGDTTGWRRRQPGRPAGDPGVRLRPYGSSPR